MGEIFLRKWILKDKFKESGVLVQAVGTPKHAPKHSHVNISSVLGIGILRVSKGHMRSESKVRKPETLHQIEWSPHMPCKRLDFMLEAV